MPSDLLGSVDDLIPRPFSRPSPFPAPIVVVPPFVFPVLLLDPQIALPLLSPSKLLLLLLDLFVVDALELVLVAAGRIRVNLHGDNRL